MRFDRCDGCGQERPQHHDDHDSYYEWINVSANWDKDGGDFCSWACLAGWATKRAMDREMTSGD